MAEIRIATFNIENLGAGADLPQRVKVLRTALGRARADVLCLQEVLTTTSEGGAPAFAGLDAVIAGTPYAGHARTYTQRPDGRPLAGQNLVVLSALPVLERHQYLNTLVPAPTYLPATADPRPEQAVEVKAERPVLHVVLGVGSARLHIVVVHLKSRIPAPVAGQFTDLGARRVWRTASGWAEGSFLSSMRRVAQALEVRRVIDEIFRADPEPLIVACGDFNADLDDVPLAAVRGDVEDTDNEALSGQVMVPCERTVPEPSRFSLYHHGRGQMLDHILVSRPLLLHYRGTEIHNELLHDESVAFATDVKFPESDHAPVIATFALDMAT